MSMWMLNPSKHGNINRNIAMVMGCGQFVFVFIYTLNRNKNILDLEIFRIRIILVFIIIVTLFLLCLWKRVGCSYPNRNITIKIDENSNAPHYLAFVIRFQQGKNDITAVQLCEVSFNIIIILFLFKFFFCLLKILVTNKGLN